MTEMPRPRPPHLIHERTRHGGLVWYVRRGKGARMRLRATYGTPEFEIEYQAALSGQAPVVRRGPEAGSLAWLVERYRDTQAWTKLSVATRGQRENILRPILAKAGVAPFIRVTRSAVALELDKRRATPFQAKNTLDTLRGLFRWAVEARLAKDDPTEGLRVARPKTEGFRVWTEAEIAQFEARWPLGTRERLSFDILLYTGLRRGDAASLGRQHVRDGIITLRTAKTGETIILPVLPELARSIAATPANGLTFIATAAGKPMVKEGFGNWFRTACDKAGVRGSAHGLRKAGATRAANAGATEAQLESLFGWRGGGMAALYTKAANRKKLALDSASKLSRPEQTGDLYSRTSLQGAGNKA